LRYTHHLFICAHERDPEHPKGDCASKGSLDLLGQFKNALRKRELAVEIRAQKSGCLDLCAQGPTVVVYPEGVFYAKVTPDDIDAIIEEHLIGGRPVERLLARLP